MINHNTIAYYIPIATLRVIIWKETNQQKWILIYEFLGHAAPITTLEWAPHQHGLILLAGSIDGCISLLNFIREDVWETRTIFAHNNGVLSVSWCPVIYGLLDPENLDVKFATAGADGLVKVWTFENEEFSCETLEKHKGWVRTVSWGNFVISGGEDGALVVWVKDSDKWTSYPV